MNRLKLKTGVTQLLNIYSFSGVSLMSFAITFLQNFIFAAILEREIFGKIFLISSLFSTFSYLFVFGLDTATFKFFHDEKFKHKNDLLQHIVATWLFLSCALFVIAVIVGYVVIVKLEYTLIQFGFEYVAILLSGILFSFFLISQQYFIASKQLLPFALSSLGARALVLGFNLLSIVIFGDNIAFFVYSYLISTLLMFLFLFGYMKMFRRLRINAETIRTMASFSVPLAFNSVISITFTNGYRVLISALIPFGGLALFGIISQVSSAYYIGLSSLMLPSTSAAYKYLEDANGSKTRIPFYWKKSFILALAGFICTIIASFALLKFFKGGMYFDGIPMLPILLIGQFCFLMYSHEYIVLTYFHLTSRITFATLIGVIVMLLTFYVLISLMGVWGACIVSLLGYAAQYGSALLFKKSIRLKS